MAFDQPLRIAYSGSLEGYRPGGAASRWRKLLNWVWTYRNTTVDPSTRSGYFFIQAVRILADQYQIQPSQLQIDWWGLINPINQEQVNEAGLKDYFTISGYLPKTESLAKMAQANILFLPLEKSSSQKHKTLFIPGKLFEYLQAGKPILSLCEESDCKEIIRRSNLGIFADADQPTQIANALLPFINDRGALSLIKPDTAYIKSHSFQNKTNELAQALKELL